MIRAKLAALFLLLTVGYALAQSVSFPGPGVGAVGGTTPTLTFNTSSSTGASTGTVSGVTFTSIAISTASASRTVIVSIGVRFATAGAVISSVTVGGIAATRVIQDNNALSGFATNASIWTAPVPTGTTANIVISYSPNDNSFIGIGVYSAYNLLSSTPVATNTSSNDSSQTLSVNTNSGGIVISNIYQIGVNAASWSGLTSDYNTATSTGAQTISGASASSVASATPRAITATLTGTAANSQAGVSASFR